MVATGSKIYYFEAHSNRQRQEVVQLISSETNLIVISNLLEALVIRAHLSERPTDTHVPHLPADALPHARSSSSSCTHEVLRRRHEAHLTVHFQNKIVVKRLARAAGRWAPASSTSRTSSWSA